jgi:hypothetical protein
MIRASIRSLALVAAGTLVVAGSAPVQAQAYLDDVTALLDVIQPENNFYSSTDPLVTWADQGTGFNRTVCTRFITESLKHSYGMTEDCLRALTGAGRPNTGHYYRAVVNEASGACTLVDGVTATHALERITSVADILPGDLVAILYLDSSEPDSGHTAWVLESPVQVGTLNGETVYDLLVADSSSSFHGYQDSRYLNPDADGNPDEGLGSGPMRLFTDANGEITGYRWSHRSKTTYRPDTRDLVIGRLTRTF